MRENRDRSKEENLHKLKALLLSDDEQRISILEKELEHLKEQFRSKEKLINALNPVIAEIIEKRISESGNQMGKVLAPVISTAIKHQIKTAKDDIIDALYPVIGKTIRKSIAEAMKKLASNVNEKLEKMLSFQVLRNRIRSRISGIPQDQLFLKSVLPFSVHEIFYIHNKSGILLAHASGRSETNGAKDDVVGGMMTAILDFAETAFEENHSLSLKEIDYDERQILFESGPHAYLALVVSGIYPDRFLENVHDLENELHHANAACLRDFDGDTALLSGAQNKLQQFISEWIPHREVTAEPEEKPISLLTKVAWLLAVIAIITGGWYLFFHEKPEDTGAQIPSEKRLLMPSAEHGILLDEITAHLGDQFRSDLSQITMIKDDAMLILEGKVSNPNDRILLSSAIAHIRPFPVIVNNLTVDPGGLSDKAAAMEAIEGMRIYFDKEDVRINPEAKSSLDELGRILQQAGVNKVYIIGHSDSTGSQEINLAISRQRAEKVHEYLETLGIDRNKMETIVKADSMPEAPNANEEGRRLNRRVTFRIEP